MIFWNQELNKYCKEGIPKIIVGTKCDLSDELKISNEEGEKFASKEELKMKHFYTSALKGINIDEIF